MDGEEKRRFKVIKRTVWKIRGRKQSQNREKQSFHIMKHSFHKFYKFSRKLFEVKANVNKFKQAHIHNSDGHILSLSPLSKTLKSWQINLCTGQRNWVGVGLGGNIIVLDLKWTTWIIETPPHMLATVWEMYKEKFKF